MTLATAQALREALRNLANPALIPHAQRYFKTGPGEYGEGDSFWGLTTPQIKAVGKSFRELPLEQIELLLAEPVHEMRSCALFILGERFKRSRHEEQRQSIVEFYLAHTAGINNWDLVDTSCFILGTWLLDKDRQILYRLANSSSMWEQRISIISTLVLIKQGELDDALALAKLLLSHPHDLMHKAVGWTLREVGKRDMAALEDFLAEHYQAMPRTTLRYAIEKMPEAQRQSWLKCGHRLT